MTIDEIKQTVSGDAYSFLRDNEHLGNKIMLLGLGGSHAYGTNIETSDLDIRGIAINTKSEILTGKDFEQVVETETDTVIYSFNRIITLFCSCNPNSIELLGLKPQQYLYLSEIGKELVDNRKLFLSQRAAYSFGGYATAQLRRLDNKAARLVNQSQQEQHILNSVRNVAATFNDRYGLTDENYLKLYIDQAVNEAYDSEIFVDVNLTHYPLRDYKGMWAELGGVVRDYSKIGKRNQNAIEHNKLNKHMMHLVRLYLMCLDILEREEINTYRENDLDLLMSIRNGDYLDQNRQPIPEFFEMVDGYEKKLEYARENTSLPAVPCQKAIDEFVESVNERVVRANIL